MDLKLLRNVTLFSSILFCPLFAQTFQEIPFDAPPLYGAISKFGDFDNDGDMDLWISGDTTINGNNRSRSYFYKNENGSFVKTDIALPKIVTGSCDWGDYDNDGDLDLLINGYTSDVATTTKIYRNDNDSFTDIHALVKPAADGNGQWGDYDNDGDLDILIAGMSLPNGPVTLVYENVGYDTFNEHDFSLPGIWLGDAGWIDYDNDMDLDIFITGETRNGEKASQLFENKSGTFSLAADFTGLNFSFFSWGDYDNNSFADLFLSGSASQIISELYKNDTTSFEKVITGIHSAESGYAAWGDFDFDNILDILVNGSGHSRIYLNTSSGFTKINHEFESTSGSKTSVADYDGDGDLDIFIAGSGVAKLYKNSTLLDTVNNTNIPQNLNDTLNNNSVILSWNTVSPDSGSFTYNVSVGTKPGLGNILSPMADSSGLRLISKPGNAGYVAKKKLQNLNSGTYYWCVQSINARYTGSRFSEIQEFTVIFDPNNQAPFVANPVPNQTIVLDRDIYQRNLNSTPNIFSDPESNTLYFSASSSDTSIAKVSLDGPLLEVLSADTGEVIISVSATDSIGGIADTAFTVWVINLPHEAVFEEQLQEISPLVESSLDWGDYDNDGDLDLVIAGLTDFSGDITCDIYQNNDGQFQAINAGLVGVTNGVVKWGDYDNDNDLDLVVSGRSAQGDTMIIYRNESTGFVNSGQKFLGLILSTADWGDYDNDGDLDLVISGGSRQGNIIKLYRNDDLHFVDSGIELPSVNLGNVDWGDYDNDGDLDLLLSGDHDGEKLTDIYINENSTFVKSDDVFEQVSYSASNFGDYDDDGDLDIILSGYSNAGPVTKIYNNFNGRYVDILATLTPVSGGNVVWGDYDNDGDFDVLVTGYNETDSTYTATIYQNYSGCFVDINAVFPGIDEGTVAWADYDNDSDLDFIISGINYNVGPITQIYKNAITVNNTPPEPPISLNSYQVGNDLVFTWDQGSDAETATQSLTYNMRIGTTPGGNELKSAMSDVANGYLVHPQMGNVEHNKKYVLKNIPESQIYWSVQSVDNAFAGSVFSSEQNILTSIDEKHQTPVEEFELFQNYPNPFNPVTKIAYTIKEVSEVTLKIYDVTGRKVSTLVNQWQNPGKYSVTFNAHNLASGMYFFKLKAGSFEQSRKMLLVK